MNIRPGWHPSDGGAPTEQPEAAGDDVAVLRPREWRRLERRALAGREQDLLDQLRALSAGRPAITGLEVDPSAGPAVTMGIDGRQVVLAPLGATSLRLLSRAQNGTGPIRFDDVGRYGRHWWVRLSTPTRAVTLLGHTLRLSSGGGGTGAGAPTAGRPAVLVGS